MVLGAFTAEELLRLRAEWVGGAVVVSAQFPSARWTFLRRSPRSGRLVLVRQVLCRNNTVIGRWRSIAPDAWCILIRSDATLLQRLDDPHGPLFLY